MTPWGCSHQKSNLENHGTNAPVTSTDKLQGDKDGERGGDPIDWKRLRTRIWQLQCMDSPRP